MKPDITLIKHALATLSRLPSGLAEEPLMTELELAAGRPLTTSQARDTIIFATDRGWLNSRRDCFERTHYWITDAGRVQLSGM